MKAIDRFLNNYTMYKSVLYGLIVIVFVSVMIGFTGSLLDTGISLVFSLVLILSVSILSNTVLARIYRVPTNTESVYITALIFFLIVSPPSTFIEILGISLALFVAFASKFIINISNAHILNPAAAGALFLSLTNLGFVSWWVANLYLLPVIVFVGFLVTRKIKREKMVMTFLITSIVTLSIKNIISGTFEPTIFIDLLTSWPLIFFATIMFTEPLTTPSTSRLQIYYALFTGAVWGSQVSLGPVVMTPELALVIGNVFSFSLSPRTRAFLSLSTKTEISNHIYEFVFTTRKKISFIPGQYMEWTFPHENVDSRGNRRYFTIASSPSENELKLGVKITDERSSYKNALLSIKSGDTIVASQVMGDFVLPDDTSKELVFIAGGIGVTPFRSIIKYLLDTNQKRNIELLYFCKEDSEFAYQDIFKSAQKKLGINVHYIVTSKSKKYKTGYLTQELLSQIKNYTTRIYYLSGPNAMVNAYKKLLTENSIPESNIVTDYFPGY